ncbi:MAG: PIN domain-containing protein [Solirubrobacterales bacterium]
MKLLDTSVAIDHLCGSPPAVGLLSGLIDAEESLLASEIVRFELLAGVRRKEAEALEQFFSAVSWVPVGEEVARVAASLAQRHRRIDDADYLIAATALLLDADLLTNQRAPFPDDCRS